MSATAAVAAVLDDEIEYARYTRWLPGHVDRRTAESSLRIGGMHCSACAGLVEQALRSVAGVLQARVSAASGCATVQWDADHTAPSAWIAAVARAGYTAVPDTLADARAARLQERRSALWRLFVAGFCAMQVMMLATPSYVSSGAQLAPDLRALLNWASWLLTLPVMAFAAAPFFAGAWRSLRGRRIGMDVPAAIGMAVAFVASSGAAFDAGGLFGHEVYFDSLTMFVSFLLAGRYLEMCIRHRAETGLEDALGRLPETALRVEKDGQVTAVSVLRLQPGDSVRVPLGHAFCADGVLTQGRTRVDEALLSGESSPIEKSPGDAVVAGSLNVGAPVTVRVERVGADTRFEAIVAMVRDARSRRPEAYRSAEMWAAPFLRAVLLLALGAAAVWSVIDPPRAVWVMVSVLIVTCPCALSLAAPSALLAAALAMARRGVLLRRIDAIEGLARMQVLFIDKTGTLTETQGRRVQMTCLDGVGGDARVAPQALRNMAASLAAWSSHPLAQAIAGDGGDFGNGGERPAHGWRDLHETAGQGLQGCDESGLLWTLGRRKAVSKAAEADADADTDTDTDTDTDADTGTEVECWLSRDGVPLARFHVAEVLRPGTADALRALQRDGVQVRLLSGDTPARVALLAQRLGLAPAAAHGGMTPQMKLDHLRAAQADGRVVAMIGDGINDAPVLAQADVSLAMGEGAQSARLQADGVLVGNALGDVVRARALARKTRRVIRQNLAWAASYNAACVPLALVGWLPPWAAGLGMASSSLVVVLNALRLAR